MYILGISAYYHDSSAALLKDGKLIAAAEEERFTRKKHDNSFPENAIRYVMSEAGISASELDYVAFYEKPLLKFERILYQVLDSVPLSYNMFRKFVPSWLNEKLRIKKTIRKKISYKGEVLYIPHHISHAASSFLLSPFKEAAILTIDGVGEWSTTTIGYGKNNKINILKEINFPHSIGLLYSTITAFLGFSVNNSEYKVMGLSPYGCMDRKKNKFYKKMKKLLIIREDGSFCLDMSYFDYIKGERMPSKKMISLLGRPREADSEIEKRHKDIAAALQMITEDAIFNILDNLYSITKTNKLVIAGGVALNSVANGKIIRNTKFDDIYILPAAGDGGTSVGAAYYVYNCILNNPRNFVLKSAYLGPSYTHKEIEKFLKDNGIIYREYNNKSELLNIVTDLLIDSNVVAWFQGRMEFGPRALGNRSILADPRNPKMQDILNLKVKHREKFRPFAPVVLADKAKEWFECDDPLPLPADFMLMVYPIKKNKRKMIPAVTHVDGSGRLQTIRREQNPLYYDLIKRFGEKTGVPILINTSFNIRGEPIVVDPFYAFRCMMGTGIDYLVMDNFLIKREDNLKYSWDSEEYAKD